jgi:DNA-binding beta-propeller fold protein YncE
MTQSLKSFLCVLLSGVVLVTCTQASGDTSLDQTSSSAAGQVPIFEVDPSWPKQLPNNWIVGVVSGVAVDGRDHIWILQRGAAGTEILAASDPPEAECCVPAPPVLELDPDGNVVQAWGGPSTEYDWPEREHGIWVDDEDNVWITGWDSDETGGHVLKFTRDGEFLLQIGGEGTGGGSNDETSFGRPAQSWVNHESNEVFVADGEANRRVIVFDAETGAYKRHWGGYGERPDDAAPSEYEPDAAPSRQFGTGAVHCLAISRDEMVYVCDRSNDRIQIFRTDGTFLEEVFIAPRTRNVGSVYAIDFSPDQRFLYVADGTNERVWILSRDELEILGWFGHPGRNVGQFLRNHDIAVDSEGNLYVGEANVGRRMQKFTFEGLGPATYYQ